MAFSEVYSISAVTISTSEISIVSGTTTLQNVTDDGVYQLWVDPVAAAMAKGDEFLIRIYEKVLAGSTKRVVFQATLADAQAELFVTPTLILMHGWDMTLIRVAGSDRDFDASIRQIA
jgi:hypothetical protein